MLKSSTVSQHNLLCTLTHVRRSPRSILTRPLRGLCGGGIGGRGGRASF